MSTTKKTDGCPVTTVLKLAEDNAKGNLGTDAANKRSKATACLTTTVTENGTATTNKVDATVDLGVESSTCPAPANCPCGCPAAACCNQAKS